MNIQKEIYNNIIKEIDKINSEDPNIEVADSESQPKELLYSKRMLKQLMDFEPNAEDDLKIAVYAQHIARWKYPRDKYPEGRIGYLTWRKELYNIHAGLAVECSKKSGANSEFLKSISTIMENKVTGHSGSQVLEDVACLVFLNYYFSDFILKHNEEKLLKIVKMTWGKMSDKAHDAALKINFPENQMVIIKKALDL